MSDRDQKDYQDYVEYQKYVASQAATPPSQNMGKPGLMAQLADQASNGMYSKLDKAMGANDAESHKEIADAQAAHPSMQNMLSDSALAPAHTALPGGTTAAIGGMLQKGAQTALQAASTPVGKVAVSGGALAAALKYLKGGAL